MSPGEKTIQYINKAVRNLPANKRPDDSGKWVRTILGVLSLLVGLAILGFQVLSGVKVESWTQMLPAGLPIAAGLFLIDAKHVLDAVKAGKKSE